MILKTVAFLFLPILTLFFGVINLSAQNHKNMKQSPLICDYWQAKIDKKIKQPNISIEEKNVQNTLEAINCLLKMKGNRNEAKFSGATKYNVSQIFENANVEVAALYYISFLYYQNWEHANAIALIDKEGNLNGTETIEKAYKSYQKWFKEVKKIGIEKAKKQNLDPLADSGVRWY